MRQMSHLLISLVLLWGLSGCRLVQPTARTLQLLTAVQVDVHASVQPQPATAATTPLLRLLGYVPNEPAYRDYLIFGNVAAWYAATNMERVEGVDAWQALDQPQRDQWAFDLPIQTLPPESLGIRYLLVEDMRAFYGFSFFDAERFVEAGMPPGNFTVVETSADPAQIDKALLATGYKTTSIANGTLYSIREDNAIDLRSPTKVGQLGQLNRIALLDHTLVIGRATALVNQVVATAQGRGANLADDPIYHALAKALAAPALMPFGQVVGVILIGQPLADDPLVMLDQGNEAALAQLDAYAQAPLQPYLALGFATQRLGDATYLTLAVVFPSTVDGASTAALLGERLSTYISVATDRPLQERWSLAETTTVEAAGLSVALVTMQVAPADVSGTVRTRPLAWSELIFQRDLLFLLVGEPVRP